MRSEASKLTSGRDEGMTLSTSISLLLARLSGRGNVLVSTQN